MRPVIIGISGATASGKTLLANTIVRELGSCKVAIISEDSYYKDHGELTLAEREKVNFDHPDAFDHNLLFQHLEALQQGKPVDIPIYDFVNHSRKKGQTRKVSNFNIIVLEGILLFADPQLRGIMDIRIFIDTPLDICLIRRIKRDIIERGRSIESILEQYQKTVRPMYVQFIEPSKQHADIIIPRGGENRIAIDMIKTKMRELLEQDIGNKGRER